MAVCVREHASDAAAAIATTMMNSPKVSRYTGQPYVPYVTAPGFVDRKRRQRLQLRAATRPERDRHPRDRGRVRRLHDVDEVVRPERRPLVEDLGAELLDVLVDLPQAVGLALSV